MSNSTELTGLTVKELRQLAGEHQIKNRSKLAKQDLIDVLRAAISSEATPADEPEVLSPATVSAEPEVLSPATVSDEPEVLSPATVSDEPAGGEDDNTAPAKTDGDSDGDDEPKKKKRRRRRRGKRKSDNGDNGDDGDANNNEQTDEAAASSEQVAEPQAAASSADQAEPEAKAEAEAASKDDEQAGDTRSDEQRNKRGRRERKERQPKPALSGKQRPLPSMLERMQRFTEGILELCDPDTPSWAQARLSELLAEAGVVPTPCQGRPHNDFHNVTTATTASDVPAGHIAIIDAPGFSLRGDRGDLFPLRKAQVQVTAGDDAANDQEENETQAPADEAPAASDQGQVEAVADDTNGEANNDESGRRRRRGGRGRRRRDEDASDEDSAPRTKVNEAEASDSQAKPSDSQAKPSDSQAKPSDSQAKPSDSQATNDVVNVNDEPTTSGPILDEPEPEAPPRAVKVVDADEAPHLPLEPQEAEELAARAKADGWRHLGLHEQILADLHEVGFVAPTAIQEQAIGIAMAGKDMIGQSQTGSGKTAAFVLPLLHRLYHLEGNGPAALILCPTRELARQVHSEFVRMAGQSGARAALIYGGVGMKEQFEALARHPHVVIGTPGRVIDHARRKTLDLSKLAVCILDEADQMLDIGFMPDIEWVLRHSPPQRQMLLFSATMPDAIRKLAETHMHAPETIHIAPKQVTVEDVDQKWIAVDRDRKTKLLAHFIDTFNPEQMVVFCNTKHQTDRVAAVLKRKKIKAAAIHGDLPQAKREKTLQGFREGSLSCLLATNVAARGIDIPSVSHVVNYDVPGNPEEYVHRIGRTGRMGRKGIARTFVTSEDGQFLLEIEKHIGLLLEEEVVEGMLASTIEAQPQRTIASQETKGPRLLKPLVGGIRLGRRRR
ncbi:MAG: DEAD/DEAH box helicase [Planctomycetota bacterium]|jgi:ATP-dependent RNA helicase DeaD